MKRWDMLGYHLCAALGLFFMSSCSDDAPIAKVPHAPIVISDSYKELVRRQLSFCQYSTPVSKHSSRKDMTVSLILRLNRDGSLQDMYVPNPILRKAKADLAYREYMLQSIDAFKRCLPFYNLPRDKYAYWREMRLTFDQGRMLF